MTASPEDIPAPLGRDDAAGDSWLGDFHRGVPSVLEACYRDHFEALRQTVRRILADADGETIIHEVFFRLFSEEDHRRNFRGGSFSAWLQTVCRNHALKYQQRVHRERPFDEHAHLTKDAVDPMTEDEIDARRFVETFRRDHLPPKWAPVFDARFIRQLTQREAAKSLELSRTTLVYQEFQIRRLLRRTLLRRSIA